MSPITSTDRHPRMVELPATIKSQFKLAMIGAALRVIDNLASEQVLAEFPFLRSYAEEAEALCGVDPDRGGLATQMLENLALRKMQLSCPSPLQALTTKVALSRDALELFLTIGLIEEDARFGAVFEWAQPGSPSQQRATLALLTAWWRDDEDCAGVRAELRRLQELALIKVVNPESPRLQWAYEPTPLLWDVVRGESYLSSVPWLEYHAQEELPTIAELVLAPGLQAKARAIPALLSSGEVRAIVVRGPLRNGRKALLRAIARAAGCGVAEVQTTLKPEDQRRACLGTLCTLLQAIPIFTLELGPGETTEIPELGPYDGPLGIALSRHGSIGGKITEHSLVLDLPLPATAARRRLWSSALGVSEDQLPEWTGRFRLTSGGIIRSAKLARTQASLDGIREISEAHVRHANRALQQPLENQAMRLQTCEGWDHIVAAPDILDELRTLADRCRHRELLPEVLGSAHAAGVNHGVRALFGGPSGSGKTLAARVLATELQMDLYRLDLSAVVNKYVGETEKNLNQILSRAEELHVILLLDEGDSLLTNRTAVQSSNDRYANLETNFLLQRIESFEGILFITTNALQRIDSAFQRRMDVLIEFRMPDPQERQQLWKLHLPARCEVSELWIPELARRCNLSGGQIRNAALHASLLALGRGSPVTTLDVELAVQREYQKMGAVCPLRRPDSGS